MDRNSNRPRGRSARDAQHLRDIAHLYLSGVRKPAVSTPRASKPCCFAVTSSVNSLARVDLCANLTLQFARLGKRALVIDLDPALPNVGFRMGLLPALYLQHLDEEVEPRIERGPLGVRILVGVAAGATPLPGGLAEDTLQELRQADCLLVNLPAKIASLQQWRLLRSQFTPSGASSAVRTPSEANNEPPAARLQKSQSRPPTAVETASPSTRGLRRTTMARAGARSRMFGQWLQTAQRHEESFPGMVEAASPDLDALLYVHQGSSLPASLDDMHAWEEALAPAPVHLVQFLHAASTADMRQPPATTSDAGLRPWATLRGVPPDVLRLPSSLLFPEHDTSRLYESLAQSLLARGRKQGVADVRAT